MTLLNVVLHELITVEKILFLVIPNVAHIGSKGTY